MPLPDITTWFLVFARVGAMLAIFPIFSSTHFPVQIRVALSALVAVLITAMLPVAAVASAGLGGLAGTIVLEVLGGLLMGFIGRMVFYAMDAAGTIMATEMGLMMSADFNPFSNRIGLIQLPAGIGLMRLKQTPTALKRSSSVSKPCWGKGSCRSLPRRSSLPNTHTNRAEDHPRGL